VFCCLSRSTVHCEILAPISNHYDSSDADTIAEKTITLRELFAAEKNEYEDDTDMVDLTESEMEKEALPVGQRVGDSGENVEEGNESEIEAMENLRVSDESAEEGRLPTPPPTSDMS